MNSFIVLCVIFGAIGYTVQGSETFPGFDEQCNITKFAENAHHINWTCTTYYKSHTKCKPRCKVDDAYEEHKEFSDYTCYPKQNTPNGIWNPPDWPACKGGCDTTDLVSNPEVLMACEYKQREKFCNVSCRSMHYQTPVDKYSCVIRKNSPRGLWTPDVEPICFPKGCHIEQFGRRNQDDWLCTRDVFSKDIMCRYRCNTGIHTMNSDMYTCRITKGNPHGKWTPQLISCPPKDHEKCDIMKTAAKRAHHIDWKCKEHNITDMTCTPYCKLGNSSEKLSDYNCKFTPGKGAVWFPRGWPNCRTGCQPTDFASGPGISISCEPREGVQVCKVNCTGMFYRSPAYSYQCVITKDNPQGRWTPDSVPICFPKGCHMDKFTTRHDVKWNCTRADTNDPITCTFKCKSVLYTTGAGTYTCNVNPDNPVGVWHPNSAPRCVPKYNQSDFCNVDHMKARNYDIEWTCKQRHYTQIVCTGICRSTKQKVFPHQVCDIRAGTPNGRWLPKDLPFCEKDIYDCDINAFSKDAENIAWRCLRTNHDEMICKPQCTEFREYLTEMIYYTCKRHRNIEGGVWSPKHLPQCVHDFSYEKCNSKEFGKSAPNVTWTCSEVDDGYTDLTCKPYCTLNHQHLFPNQYNCTEKPNVRGGVWNPESPPNCKKNCDFKKFAKGKNIYGRCTRAPYKTVCEARCDGKFEIPPESNYTCIASQDYPEGQWTPDTLPQCTPESCDFVKYTRGSDAVAWCDRRVDDNVKSCYPTCSGSFERTPELEYHCITSMENPEGTWTPTDDVPRCIGKKGKPIFIKKFNLKEELKLHLGSGFGDASLFGSRNSTE